MQLAGASVLGADMKRLLLLLRDLQLTPLSRHEAYMRLAGRKK